jgi:amidophosphoribosyltransferase
MSTREEMIAHDRTTAEVAEELGCDSLHYLSMEGVYEAVRGTRATHCDACFTGEYPLAGSGDANGKYALEDEQNPTGPPLPLVRA